MQIFRKKQLSKKDLFGRFHTLLDSRMRLQNATFGKTKHKRAANTHASQHLECVKKRSEVLRQNKHLLIENALSQT